MSQSLWYKKSVSYRQCDQCSATSLPNGRVVSAWWSIKRCLNRNSRPVRHSKRTCPARRAGRFRGYRKRAARTGRSPRSATRTSAKTNSSQKELFCWRRVTNSASRRRRPFARKWTSGENAALPAKIPQRVIPDIVRHFCASTPEWRFECSRRAKCASNFAH